jgi:hypothetical protein
MEINPLASVSTANVAGFTANNRSVSAHSYGAGLQPERYAKWGLNVVEELY